MACFIFLVSRITPLVIFSPDPLASNTRDGSELGQKSLLGKVKHDPSGLE